MSNVTLLLPSFAITGFQPNCCPYVRILSQNVPLQFVALMVSTSATQAILSIYHNHNVVRTPDSGPAIRKD
jgi:hypothetical protein